VEENVRSKISGVSKLKGHEIKKAGRRAFEWWGPSPEAARSRMVNKSKALKDKRYAAVCRRYEGLPEGLLFERIVRRL
jgi:hypothetical protein